MSGQGPADGNKGKGKSTDEAPTSTSTSSTASTSADGSSVLSRIGRSAAGLGRDLVNTRPAGGELSALSAGDKGASSSSRGPSSGTLQETSHQNTGSYSSAPTSASTSAGFRSHAQQHNTAQEEAFSKFLDGTSVDFSMPEQVVGLSPAEDAWARAQWSTAAPQQVASQAWTNTTAQSQSQSDVAAQESRDGLDVVNLLSADGPPEEEPNYDDIELAEYEATALKRALFGDNTSTAPSLEWDNVLNFVPDFVRPHAHGAYDGDSHATAKGNWTQSTTGMQHSPEAARAWIEQWHGVLTRYDDEVWGGLSPLVAEAREEVEQLKESEPEAERPGSTKALDRLRQILGHLRVD